MSNQENVTSQEQVARSRAARLAQVDRVVRASAAAVPVEHPSGRALRTAFDDLRHRLGRAHADCDGVDDRAWADYVARLDRGLDELVVEVDRAGPRPDAGPDEVLYVHATRLELDGWSLRFDHAGDGSATVRELAARADRELADHQRGEASRADVERALDGVRDLAVR